MSEVRVNNLSNENNTGGPTLSGITTFPSPYFFVPPQGDTASRPSDCEPGSFRFNTDSAKLEYYRGDTIGWVEVEAELTEPLGESGASGGLGYRGLVFGGYRLASPVSTQVDTIDYHNLSAVFPCGGTKKCGLEKVVIPDIVGPPDKFSFDKLLTLTSDIYC